MASVRARPAAAPALSASSLERRIDLLTKEGVMSKARLVSAMAVTVGLTVLAAAGAVRAVPLGGGDAPPGKLAERKVTVRVNPTYPADAKARKIEGDVVTDVLITAAGEVTDVKAVKGPAELTQAAVDAARQWRFAPAKADTRGQLTFRFTLDGDDKAPR
jgi:TonB family protein